MKKNYPLFLFFCLSLAVNAQVNIPDADFKTYLVGIADTDSDSEIQTSEAEAITGTIAPPNTVADLTGLEAFINATVLDIGGNANITGNVNLTANTKLVDIIAWNTSGITGYTGLDGMADLNFINMAASGLTGTLTITNSSLKQLWMDNCKDNTGLDLSGCPNLERLDCRGNAIPSLDFSSNTNLKDYLKFGSGDLTSVNLANGNNAGILYLELQASANLTSIKIDCDFDPVVAGWPTLTAPATYDDTESCSLSIDNLDAVVEGELYPNPATGDVVNISIKNGITTSVNIYTITGKLVKKVANSNKINVADLSKGLYLFTIETSIGNVTKKLIKL
ncbi:T9SS type A sorting domain-containing protein [Thalassobellus citreus]|uniref:T9SS type A sorting domain-containing protein n=1 Tax=Thalassobellus citreus TaxID=3367752 RepID=UPI0037978D4D